MGVVVVVDLYCARRRDWCFAAAEVDGEGEKVSESGEEVCGRYGDEEEGVWGPSSNVESIIDMTVTVTPDAITSPFHENHVNQALARGLSSFEYSLSIIATYATGLRR